MISCRLDKNRNERCIYDERGWEVIVSAMASFFMWKGVKMDSVNSSMRNGYKVDCMQKIYYYRRLFKIE